MGLNNIKRKYFDVHDRDVTPIVYLLMFSVVELEGNDLAYNISPDEWEDCEYFRKQWEDRLKRGAGNCYYDNKAMQKMMANPPTVSEALIHFKKWLKKQGYKKGDNLSVKIWW